MADTIIDGTGGGYQAAVSSDHRLQVDAVTESEALQANERGDAYNFNTGIITLTNATETPVIYFKNNEENDFVISTAIIGIWASDGDGLDMSSIIYRNPKAGTIVSNETAVAINSNRNYGSSNVIDGDIFLGGTGVTMTGGAEHLILRVTEEARSVIPLNEILPKGASIGVSITPPTSNTSMNCYVALTGYRHE